MDDIESGSLAGCEYDAARQVAEQGRVVVGRVHGPAFHARRKAKLLIKRFSRVADRRHDYVMGAGPLAAGYS
jgi:hypothetical protein